MRKKDTKITISFPEIVEIDFVPANELKHYERFQWLVALLAPIATGFWVAYVPSDESYGPLFFSSAVFTAVTLLFGVLAWRYRGKIFNGKIKREVSLSSFR